MDFYAEHSPLTRPGEHTALYDDLPDDPTALFTVVQGLCVHIMHAARYCVEVSEDRLIEVQLYSAEDLVTRILDIDDSPLSVERHPDLRLAANCRQYSVLYCSMLRHVGIPARVRVGFETYLTRDRYGDHWVCECWNEDLRRWAVVDPELDGLHCYKFDIDFDPMDVPEGKYFTAGEMWRQCRDGRINPDLCGFHNHWGLWYVRNSVVRDVLCLNKVEVRPWDGTRWIKGLGKELDNSDLEFVDQLAAATSPEVDVEAVMRLFEERPELHEIQSLGGDLESLLKTREHVSS